MQYANSKKIPYVVIAGEEEMKENLITVKDMKTGEQKKATASELLIQLKD
jgi:histidyl-tRNA synthetase